MPSVSMELRVTMQIPDQSFGSFTAGVKFDDIDIDQPIEPQLERCKAALGPTADGVEESLAQAYANVSGLAIEGLGLNKEFGEFKGQVSSTLRKLIERVKEHTGALRVLGGEAPEPQEEAPAEAPAAEQPTGEFASGEEKAAAEKPAKEPAAEKPEPASRRRKKT